MRILAISMRNPRMPSRIYGKVALEQFPYQVVNHCTSDMEFGNFAHSVAKCSRLTRAIVLRYITESEERR
jgi:hypothetical protein